MIHQIIICLVLVYLGWRIFSRFRREIGRQLYRPTRLRVYFGMFVLLSVVFAIRGLAHPPSLLPSWLGGLVLGILLGIKALRHTHFETTAEGRFYTSGTRIGIALSLLFVARIVFQAFTLYLPVLQGGKPPAFHESPATFFVFELLAGYNMAYGAGMLSQGGRKREGAADSAPVG